MYDLQKANIWKRISAALCDLVLLAIVVIGAATALSAVLGYDRLAEQLQDVYDGYEQLYGIDLEITAEAYEALTDAECLQYEAAQKALTEDAEMLRLYSLLMSNTLIIITFSVLFAYLLLELVVPLLFKNGQTLGKKVFGVGVMREDGVRLTLLQLFIRTVLGKYTVETMIPVMIFVLIFFNVMGIVGIFLLGLLLTVELAFLIGNATRPLLHDKMARTVCVDMASQMIFETEDELLAYKKRVQAERAEKAPY